MKPKDVLDAAAARLTEEKVETGGPHEAAFPMIARLWAAYLKVPVPPRGVAVMMAMLKASRVKCAPYPSDGNFVDMAGYAGLAADLQEGASLGNPSAAAAGLAAGGHGKAHEWIMGRCCCKGGEWCLPPRAAGSA